MTANPGPIPLSCEPTPSLGIWVTCEARSDPTAASSAFTTTTILKCRSASSPPPSGGPDILPVAKGDVPNVTPLLPARRAMDSRPSGDCLRHHGVIRVLSCPFGQHHGRLRQGVPQ